MDKEDLVRGGKQGARGSSEPTLHPGIMVNNRPPSIEEREATALPGQPRGGASNPAVAGATSGDNTAPAEPFAPFNQ